MDAVVVSLLEVGRVLEADLARFWTVLSRIEQAEIDRVADRRTMLCARALVRLALSNAHPGVTPDAWTFGRTEVGKPYIEGEAAPDLDFNLSHTDGLVVCAVGRSAVGVDAEPLARGPAVLDTVVQAFAPAEVAALRALPEGEQMRRAVELWTVKEAYLKGLGTGISRRLDRFAVTPCGDGMWAVDEDARWRITLREHRARWIVAVATTGAPAIAFRDILPT